MNRSYGPDNPKWRGGRWLSRKDGYIYLTRPYGLNGPKRRMEHVVIAEKALGRPLKHGEMVHHWNGIKTDNRNHNLLICSVAYHTWLHHEMGRRWCLEHFGPPPA